jgi:DNA-binding MarR family transcriptional regulator
VIVLVGLGLIADKNKVVGVASIADGCYGAASKLLARRGEPAFGAFPGGIDAVELVCSEGAIAQGYEQIGDAEVGCVPAFSGAIKIAVVAVVDEARGEVAFASQAAAPASVRRACCERFFIGLEAAFAGAEKDGIVVPARRSGSLRLRSARPRREARNPRPRAPESTPLLQAEWEDPGCGAMFARPQLAETFAMTRGNVSHCVSELEGQGLLKRRIDPEDARAYHLMLTPQGKKCAVRAIGALDKLQKEFENEIGKAHLGEMLKAIRKLEVRAGG